MAIIFPGMKPVSDLIQIGLSLPSALGYLAAVVLVLTVWQGIKLARKAVFFVRAGLSFLFGLLIRLTPRSLAAACFIAIPVYLFRTAISDRLQYLEQIMQPAYVTGDTSRALAIYEAELQKWCDPYELQVVKDRTRAIAARVGCSPLAIYEVAYSECGLDPFRIRTDGVAAGWIQFTRVGLTGLGETLEGVKAACKRRDVVRIMDLTDAYLVSRAKDVPLVDAAGVYTCVFAPGHVGSPDGQVLYQGWGNPAYRMNDIFDGYYIDGRGRIIRSRAAMDGRITIGEMRLHLEAKKSRLLAAWGK